MKQKTKPDLPTKHAKKCPGCQKHASEGRVDGCSRIDCPSRKKLTASDQGNTHLAVFSGSIRPGSPRMRDTEPGYYGDDE